MQLYQGRNTTKTKATGTIETDTRTSGDYEHGQDNFHQSFGQDGFQLYQGENTTKTKATGGIETDTRTSGDYEHGQDNFQQSENKGGTRINQDGIVSDLVKKYQDGICDFQQS